MAVFEFQQVGLRQAKPNFLGNGTGTRACDGPVALKLAKHHHKFISAHARDRVHIAHSGTESAGDFDQQQVARRMTVRVVEGLEIVQVQKQHGAAKPAAFSRRHGLIQPIGQQTAVGQLGQRVIKRQLTHLVFHLAALGGLARDAVKPHQFAFGIVFGPGQNLRPQQPAVLAAVLHFKSDKTFAAAVWLHAGFLCQQLLNQRNTLGGEHFKNMVTNHLIGCKTAQPLVRGADVGDKELGIGLPKHVQRVFRQQFVQGLALVQLSRALVHLHFERVVALLQAGQRINLAFIRLPVGNRDATVYDFPVFTLLPENQHQASHFA